ncbi:MAG: polysaccharide biosynthesis protein [Bacteroides sp.]|nr:polysaccharide biosynthesis protein [Bacteroides sp.]MCM1095242.1 polysaccharide biosynthesis protein [Terasakiella sp.]
MTDTLAEYIKRNPICKSILSKPSPWWFILLVDFAIVMLSCWATFSLNKQPESPTLGFWGTRLGEGVVTVAIYLAYMMAVRPFRYIVRLSVVQDLFRVSIAVVGAAMTQFVITAAVRIACGDTYIQLWNIFVIALLSFTMMMLCRLAIKYIYQILTTGLSGRKRVVVLASGMDSFNFARALLNEPDGQYRPVALISLGTAKASSINGLPLYTFDKETVASIFEKHDAATLMFPSSSLNSMRQGLADTFLSHHIKLLTYNSVNEFDGTADSARNTSASVRDINIEDLLGRDVIKPDTAEVLAQLRGQVVMVTGAAGSIGSEIVNQVAQMGVAELVLVDQAETPMHELQLFMESRHPDTLIHLFVGDVANGERMEQAFMRYRPRYVFHAAAYKHVPMMERNPAEAILTNVIGTKTLADLAVRYRVDKFVMISTDKAVNPTNVMGASKRIAEIYVQSLFFHNRQHTDGAATQFITTRFGNVLGSNGSVIPLFRRQIEHGGPVTVTHRDIIRYFMTIPEACSLVLQAGTMGHGGEIFIFDMGQPVRIYDLATRMISLSGLRPGEDIEIVETGLRPGEKLYEELLNDKERTMATTNDKIMIAKVRIYDYLEVSEHIVKLQRLTARGEYHDIVAEMKRMVPEYKSQNSVWASIDREIPTGQVITEIQPR